MIYNGKNAHARMGLGEKGNGRERGGDVGCLQGRGGSA